MFILDILIYALFAWVMFKFAYKANMYTPASKMFKRYVWYFMLFFTFICAIRWNVGVDSLGYMISFAIGQASEMRTNEILFQNLVKYIHLWGIHYTVGMGITAFVQIYFIVKSVKDYPYILIFMPIVLFGGSHFLGLTNAVRQMMAASIFLYASRFIVDRKPIFYCIAIYLASLIHHSALLMLPFYLVTYIPYKYLEIPRKRIILIIILFGCLFLGLTPRFQSYASSLELLSQQFGYEDYTSSLSKLLSSQYDEERRAFGPMQLSYFLTAIALSWWGPMLKKEFDNKIRYFDIWYLFAYLYCALFFLVCNISHIFIRPILYFQLFQLIIVSLLLYYFFKYKLKIYLIVMSFIICVATSWNIIKNENVPRESVTYKICLFHDIDSWIKK